MPLVIKPRAFACRAERLAGAASGPHWSVVRPSGSAQGEAPDSNSGEEMALGVSPQVFRIDILYAPLVHITGGNMAGGYQVAQPLGCIRVCLIVVRRHIISPQLAGVALAQALLAARVLDDRGHTRIQVRISLGAAHRPGCTDHAHLYHSSSSSLFVFFQ
jgi:hypothetical protein